jgi:hypothetical protein
MQRARHHRAQARTKGEHHIMSITKTDSGAVVITGGHIQVARLFALKGALKLENLGLRMRRGVTVYQQVKNEFGFAGNRARVLAQLVALCETVKAQGQAGGDIQ